MTLLVLQSVTCVPKLVVSIISIPLGFLATFVGALLSREPAAEEKYTELIVRAHTGLGAEKASGH